jgi:hypothetical protein
MNPSKERSHTNPQIRKAFRSFIEAPNIIPIFRDSLEGLMDLSV